VNCKLLCERRPLVRFVRRWGFTGYGSTPLHYPLHPSTDQAAACQCERRHYGRLRIVIVSRIAEDRTLHCRIRANVRSIGLIRAKICSIHISCAFRPRSDLFRRDPCRICGNDGSHWVYFNALYVYFNSYKSKLYVSLFKFIYRFSYCFIFFTF